MEGRVKVYPVQESEVKALSHWNRQATTFFSIASALSAYVIGIWTTAVFAEKLTFAGQVAAMLFAPTLFGGALVCAGLGLNARRALDAKWATIKRESIERDATPATATP